ncbi:MAG: carboxylating nicotinate-nucleotide diphosphorylase, partial [Magnetospirillum sp.]
MPPSSLPPGLDEVTVRRVIETALAEDVGAGDVTSQAVIPESTRFSGIMAAREPMVLAGLSLAERVFLMVEPACVFTPMAKDGDRLSPGTTIARIEGRARGLLTAERTALNLLQHLSGIATLTRRYADAIEGTGAILLDTRKTIPGLRQMAKYASRMGGARNHRLGLYDAVLIKDNHVAVCGSVLEAVRRAKSAQSLPVEAECDTLPQVQEALDAGADKILLDNMAPDVLRQAVALVNGRVPLEASGGVTQDTIRAIAETGVNFISVGRLTQSAPAADIGL